MSIGKGGYNTNGKSKAQLRADQRKAVDSAAAGRKQRNLGEPVPF